MFFFFFFLKLEKESSLRLKKVSAIDHIRILSIGLELACNGFLVSKETVVLRRWGRSKQKFGFIKRVDKGQSE